MPTADGPFGSPLPSPLPTGVPAGTAGPDGADRNKIAIDRRLLFAGAGVLLVLVVVFASLTFLGGNSSGPTAEAAAGAPAPAASGNPRDALRAQLNQTVMTGCTAPARSDSAYADATLNCQTPGGVKVSAFHFPNRSAVDRQIGAREAFYFDEGNCDDGQQSSERWSSPEAGGGDRLCYFYAKNFYEFWTYDNRLIAFSVDDVDAGRLNSWWHSFDPLRH
ncbi:hypothetical protein [Frankia sp. AiPa1]|uniref:hypothetical protein n=1 Tax=Frankia sp. AiPa1 TaxID=573492 RepID=UPI00202B0A02|nr:hypothetical protein [Frankia sp. AiPa1]MCL9757704.1 hypothetical protein [Frankia sp. AiPa1]